MFSLKVVDTDLFLDMSPSAQNLYFHLGMRADDDGFVSSPKKIANMVNAAENDYQILVAKGFIIPMATNGVCVVTHWKTNNLIKSDRYSETEYKEEKEHLVEVDGKYTFEHLLTPRQKQSLSGSKMVPVLEPQVRLGKGRKDSGSEGEPPSLPGVSEPETTVVATDEEGNEPVGKPSKARREVNMAARRVEMYFAKKALECLGKPVIAQGYSHIRTLLERHGQTEERLKEIVDAFFDDAPSDDKASNVFIALSIRAVNKFVATS